MRSPRFQRTTFVCMPDSVLLRGSTTSLRQEMNDLPKRIYGKYGTEFEVAAIVVVVLLGSVAFAYYRAWRYVKHNLCGGYQY